MGWIISVGLFISYFIAHEPVMLLASGLFAIAGSVAIRNNTKK